MQSPGVESCQWTQCISLLKQVVLSDESMGCIVAMGATVQAQLPNPEIAHDLLKGVPQPHVQFRGAFLLPKGSWTKFTGVAKSGLRLDSGCASVRRAVAVNDGPALGSYPCDKTQNAPALVMTHAGRCVACASGQQTGMSWHTRHQEIHLITHDLAIAKDEGFMTTRHIGYVQQRSFGFFGGFRPLTVITRFARGHQVHPGVPTSS